MEYALYGNLRDYLRSFRRTFLFSSTSSFYSHPHSVRSIEPHPSTSSDVSCTYSFGRVNSLTTRKPFPYTTPHAILGEYLKRRTEGEQQEKKICTCDVFATPNCPCCGGGADEAEIDPWHLYANINGSSALWQHVRDGGGYYCNVDGPPLSPIVKPPLEQTCSCDTSVYIEAGSEDAVVDDGISEDTQDNGPPNSACATMEHNILSDTDILNCALQIARGMEHLEKLRVCIKRN